MAISTVRRRILAIRLEGTSGTFSSPNPTTSIDNTPLLRAAKITPTPISVERPTLRLTQTPIGDIYPGVSTATLEATFELCSHGNFSGDATLATKPNLTRWLDICGFGPFEPADNVFGYKVTAPAVVDAGPLRHREIVVGTTGPTLGNAWRVVGDTYADDGVVYVTQPAGTFSSTTFAGQTSGSTFTVGSVGSKVFAWGNNSDLNGVITNGTANASLILYEDGKAWSLKGAAGNLEFEFKHGDAVLVNATIQGIVTNYTDVTLPVPLDLHKSPPTFLGSRVTLRHPVNAPTTSQRYGTGGTAGGGITGSLNSIKIRTGNDVVLHENSMDPSGVNFAIITGRKPTGSFNPDEVRESEFSFIFNFILGNPLRFRVAAIGPPAGSVVFDTPTTFNQNAYDFIVPGIVQEGMGDGDRDGINAWDGTFKIGGGNYVVGQEAPGSDNEITIINR